MPQQTNVQANPAASAITGPNAFGFNPQLSTSALNAMGLPDTPEGRAQAAAMNPALLNSAAAGGPKYVPPGMINSWWQQQSPGAAGTLAIGNIAGSPDTPNYPGGWWGQYNFGG